MPPLDRHRIVAFARFTVRRFLDDNCLQTAGALAYTSLFAMVPLTAATLGILAEFPAFAQWRDRITSFVFANFVPATGNVVQEYLTQFANNASKTTAVGVLVLLFSAVLLMHSIEDAFNRIWRVNRRRSTTARFVMYWSVLTLGPLLLVAALGLGTSVFTLPYLDAADAELSIQRHLLGWAPFLIEWLGLIAAYRLIPNRHVPLRDAALGALFAALALELAKRGFTAYATTGANYQQIYGALAIVPIFILWIYLSWILVLLGASLTATLSAFDYRPATQRIAAGEEFLGLMRVLAHFAAAQREGRGLSSAQLREREPYLSEDQVQRYIADLDSAGVIQRNEHGQWLLVRDLVTLSLYEIYAKSGYRLPLGELLPAAQGPPDAVAKAVLERAQARLRATLEVPLAEIFPVVSRSEAAATRETTQEKQP